MELGADENGQRRGGLTEAITHASTSDQVAEMLGENPELLAAI